MHLRFTVVRRFHAQPPPIRSRGTRAVIPKPGLFAFSFSTLVELCDAGVM
jgi:hypothetical protein